MKISQNRVYNLGIAVFATVAVISIAVTVTVLMRPLYYFDLEYLNIPNTSGISKETCKLNYDTLIDYNLLGGPSELIFPTLPMSQQGRAHFEEVKDIFTTMQLISIVTVLLLGIWVVLYKKGKVKYFKWMRLTVIITLAIAAIVGIAVMVDWESTFVVMHKLFFRNDYWIFNSYTDPVIKILPEEFFFHCGVLIILLIFIQIFTLEFAYRRLKNGRTNL